MGTLLARDTELTMVIFVLTYAVLALLAISVLGSMSTHRSSRDRY